jgi:hypothetical protein
VVLSVSLPQIHHVKARIFNIFMHVPIIVITHLMERAKRRFEQMQARLDDDAGTNDDDSGDVRVCFYVGDEWLCDCIVSVYGRGVTLLCSDGARAGVSRLCHSARHSTFVLPASLAVFPLHMPLPSSPFLCLLRCTLYACICVGVSMPAPHLCGVLSGRCA